MQTPTPPSPDPQRLTTSLLLWAYPRGWFPMANPLTDDIEWFSPDPRAVIPLGAFHVPKSLMREVRRGRFDIRCDTAFEAVMQACASPRSSDDLSWIDHRLIEAYVGLHRIGHAHSIEAWLDDRLVGGLYGVHIGGAFFGESMFTRPALGGANASKVCLVHLARWLRYRDFTVLDTQFHTEHLDQFGCVEIQHGAYMVILAEALDRTVTWGQFSLDENPVQGP